MIDRPPPQTSATAFVEGKLAYGNDGKLYRVEVNKAGVHQWKLAKTAAAFMKKHGDRAKQVVTVDNGGEPLSVFLTPGKTDEFWREIQLNPGQKSGPGRAHIFAMSNDGEERMDLEKLEVADQQVFWREIPYINAFVGFDRDTELRSFYRWEQAKKSAWRRALGLVRKTPPHEWWYGGNSVLLQTEAQEYMFLGERVFRFCTPGDEIVQFVSDMGNSAVPYPFAVGRERVYFMLGSQTMEQARKGLPLVPVSAPLHPRRKGVPSPLSEDEDNPDFPYSWLWPCHKPGPCQDRERGQGAKHAGTRPLAKFEELLPRVLS
jgi:hypothetical protein